MPDCSASLRACGFSPSKTVLISGFDPAGAREVHVLIQLARAGPIVRHKTKEGQYLFAEFSRSSEVDVALELNEREIEGTKIRVQKATDESIPEDAERFLKESSIAKVRHFSVEQLDEVSRTIYVGGVSSEVSAEELMKVFQICGEITLCRIAGDAGHPSRFAFIEFSSKEATDAAMLLNGTTVHDRPLKINRSKNPIVKKPLMSTREEEISRKRVKEKQLAISLRVQARMRGLPDPDKRNSSSRGSSRSRSPDSRKDRKSRKSSRRRSRSRSKSKERSRRHRSRSRSPYRRRSSRSRDRSHRDKKDRDRERGRDKDRDRSGKRNRSKSAERPDSSPESKRHRSKLEDAPVPAPETDSTLSSSVPEPTSAPVSAPVSAPSDAPPVETPAASSDQGKHTEAPAVLQQ